jgi:hypothetical protein
METPSSEDGDSLVGELWARQDLNLQPTDYEFDTTVSDDQDETPEDGS